ncbi:helix-turn-helix domain-containing protein [Micromonospora sp. WMMA1998]|uniref:helix-turn-helix domain-containing protein n=1 Tax=Micromonospora sp. WMMA1998 TaxID=3015167 RepID=UPI00248BC0C3|nr:helix-turn-helix domain-containing protein [Micromonospora sp. WMMA1998]WBC13372.1 helix-turn-helix domain-containing protein [Micromonospora sp. WMMA1998]
MAASTSAAQPPFGAELRRMRAERTWSLRDLAERITYNRGYIGKVEQGEKFPDRQFAERADQAFGTRGALIEAWQFEANQRHDAERMGKLLTASVKDSLRLLTAAEDRHDLAQISDGVDGLAVAYLGAPPGPMLQDAVELRGEVLQRLRDRHHAPHELRDLYLLLGRLQGVLAYAALDLGSADAAMTHADAAWTCAEHAGDNELRAWTRGTQSLIARFKGDYAHALDYVHDGLRYKARGTGRIRLLCGVAQCHANLGDSAGANRTLDLAQTEREELASTDSVDGLFGFSVAKQHYYAGSSLIWLAGGADAERAAREAGRAIELWEAEPPESRSLDDEALAHVYQGTALLQVGDLDAATAAIRPILDLPADRQISWIKKRLDRFAAMLRAEPYRGASAADDLYEEIRNLDG